MECCQLASVKGRESIILVLLSWCQRPVTGVPVNGYLLTLQQTNKTDEDWGRPATASASAMRSMATAACRKTSWSSEESRLAACALAVRAWLGAASNESSDCHFRAKRKSKHLRPCHEFDLARCCLTRLLPLNLYVIQDDWWSHLQQAPTWTAKDSIAAASAALTASASCSAWISSNPSGAGRSDLASGLNRLAEEQAQHRRRERLLTGAVGQGCPALQMGLDLGYQA
ncbi:MAG: hypothetical protein FRX49_02634 [Trebouxia sp. A1-2]|nr:MAG: hypothetical protein FRX49_02634 [Trebouxia sp. A1-2]